MKSFVEWKHSQNTSTRISIATRLAQPSLHQSPSSTRSTLLNPSAGRRKTSRRVPISQLLLERRNSLAPSLKTDPSLSRIPMKFQNRPSSRQQTDGKRGHITQTPRQV